MKPMHVLRPAGDNLQDRAAQSRRGKRAHPQRGTPAVEYPPGYFTELIRRHNWPPRFEPHGIDGADLSDQRRLAALVGRERAADAGVGWGSGTMVMPKTPGHLRPGFMGSTPK